MEISGKNNELSGNKKIGRGGNKGFSASRPVLIHSTV
jgi:hypothetical protein